MTSLKLVADCENCFGLCCVVPSFSVSASRRSSTRIVSSIGVSSRTCETTECSARSAEDAVDPQLDR